MEERERKRKAEGLSSAELEEPLEEQRRGGAEHHRADDRHDCRRRERAGDARVAPARRGAHATPGGHAGTSSPLSIFADTAPVSVERRETTEREARRIVCERLTSLLPPRDSSVIQIPIGRVLVIHTGCVFRCRELP